MNTRFDRAKITELLNDFYNTTGVSIELKDSLFNQIGRSENGYTCFCEHIHSSKTGSARCYESDMQLFKRCEISRKPEIHTCHAGLTDMSIPIIFSDKIVAYVILGQIKNDLGVEEIIQRVADLDIGTEVIKKDYLQLPSFNDEKIKSIANIAIILAEHILLKNLIEHNIDKGLQNAEEYINEHLEEMIEISDICEAVNISKSVLYKKFEKQFGVPPKKYINSKKIENAKWKLKYSDVSIENIAVSLGFENIGYFYRLFKRETGKTPQQYRSQD